jgi:hypothetical protein
MLCYALFKNSLLQAMLFSEGGILGHEFYGVFSMVR